MTRNIVLSVEKVANGYIVHLRGPGPHLCGKTYVGSAPADTRQTMMRLFGEELDRVFNDLTAAEPRS